MANTARAQLPSYSMWATTPAYTEEVGGESFIVFGLLDDAVVPDPSDEMFTVPIGGVYRFDLISANFYGVPDLWWAIARCNGVLDPLVGVPVNTKVRIPTKARLAQLGILSV